MALGYVEPDVHEGTSPSHKKNLTEVMNRVCFRPLSRGLILEQTKKEIFAEYRVSVEQDRPSWHDHVNSVDILRRSVHIRTFRQMWAKTRTHSITRYF